MITLCRQIWRRTLHASRMHPRQFDVLLTLVFVVFAYLFNQSAAAATPPLQRVDMTWWRDALIALALVPFAFRRLYPAAALLGTAVLGFVSYQAHIQDFTMIMFAAWLCLHSVGSHGVRGRNPVRALVATGGLAFVVHGLATTGSSERMDSNLARMWIIVLSIYFAYVGTAWAMGEFSRERRETTDLLAMRAEQLERSQSENARRAVLDERVRISRELHDVVAHHVSVMGVQAGAARRVMAKDPQLAAEALGAIEQSSRSAVGEMQRLIGFLRQEGDTEDLAPQPSLGQLDRLVEGAATEQLAVKVKRVGTVAELAPSVELSAYRIVQEALTNTLKHADATRVEVTLRYGPEALEIEVLDDGRNRGAVGNAVGNGLRGMRERVALLGGTLETRPTGLRGFLVRAHLPLNAASFGAGGGATGLAP